MNRPKKQHSFTLSLVLTLVVAGTLAALYHFAPALQSVAQERTGLIPDISETIVKAIKSILWLIFAFVVVRAVNELIFGLAFRRRRGYEAPDLIRNIFSLVAYLIVFALIFHSFNISLGAIFTTSAVFGVILGLALQSTLGNLFAGISLQADKPFQVGDVITVEKWTGVVESVTWRGVKLRTFQNHIVLVSNTTIANYAIEVCPRGNLNARTVFFSALYTDSPARVIHVVREAVRETENVATELTPVVRIRNLGDNGVEYECKYWLNNYAMHNDTDALVRQRIWYAFHRAKINFAFPTRTLHVSRPPQQSVSQNAANDRTERLSAVDIFAPLSEEEMAALAASSESHIFAPGETIIRAGDEGASMYVVHRGHVAVQRAESDGDQAQKTIAMLHEGDFFGEMGLFTGERRAANVVARAETEVLEIGHNSMRQLFETNPDLMETVGRIIGERRAGLAARPEKATADEETPDGLLASIKRFFRFA